MSKLEEQVNQLQRAVLRIGEVLELVEERELYEIVRDSAIKRFEMAFDLAWKTIKTYLKEKEGLSCNSPRSCLKEAFTQGLIEHDEGWLTLIDLRNEAVHTYNEDFAEKVYDQLPEALRLLKGLLKNINQDQDQDQGRCFLV